MYRLRTKNPYFIEIRPGSGVTRRHEDGTLIEEVPDERTDGNRWL